jgi:hypothetical protein
MQWWLTQDVNLAAHRLAMVSLPVVRRTSRPMMLSSVLLPEPDGPVGGTMY